MSGQPLVVHGHFYQPPRENPWTGRIDVERGAHPFHDWNERILWECYRANAYARILDDRGRRKRIVNNYARTSFNFGPTLAAWIAHRDPATADRILEADRVSASERGGHGNAIAQGYNHAILPLLDERDRRTQVRWGTADFRIRFGRDPEALWLPETAADDRTLATLIEEGMRYAILSPRQALRARKAGSEEWRDVSDGAIDPSLPYRYLHRDGSGRSLTLFFYDGTLARAVSFEGALASSQTLVEALERARGNGGGLVHVAVDGETFGHHRRFGDLSLAYALEVEAAARGFEITNYGEVLDRTSPGHEAEIWNGPLGEGSSWSCEHGVGRWLRDCGCSTGGLPGWNQAWRAPLRAAFELIREESRLVFEEEGARWLKDPWAARDSYIEILLRGPQAWPGFFERHARRPLSADERSRLETALELERNAMLLFTSCGWFFADISGLEALQVMKYAARAMQLLEALSAPSPRARFLERLAETRSNVPEEGTGADIYRRSIEPLAG